MNAYKRFFRPLLFRMDPEGAHHLALRTCSIFGGIPPARKMTARFFGAPNHARLRTRVAGIDFPNPVGLGAGYDKNAEGIALLANMGFGFLEIGSVSKLPSTGNAIRPRSFRLPADEALIINYGVPNHGSNVVAERLRKSRVSVPVGVNLVETNTRSKRPDDEVVKELVEAAALFVDTADFIVVSAECANSDSTHPFARLENLKQLLRGLARYDSLPPVFIKIRVPVELIDTVLAITDGFAFVRGFRINVIVPRPFTGLKTPAPTISNMRGSLTGPAHQLPLMLQSVKAWYARIDPTRYSLIASGGIRSGEDAYAAVRAGAALLQFVTALVYEGPGLARRINAELSELLRLDGFTNIDEAVGSDHQPSRIARGE